MAQHLPYFCPSCNSNRVKFSILSRVSQEIMKDAQSGEIMESAEPRKVDEDEPMIQCRVCHYIGNEMRFVKQAERNPRVMTETRPIY